MARGINNLGQIEGSYIQGTQQSFVYGSGVFTTVALQSATATNIWDINDHGYIAGQFSNPSAHGFLAVAIPEPGTMSMLLLGAFGLLGFSGVRRSR